MIIWPRHLQKRPCAHFSKGACEWRFDTQHSENTTVLDQSTFCLRAAKICQPIEILTQSELNFLHPIISRLPLWYLNLSSFTLHRPFQTPPPPSAAAVQSWSPSATRARPPPTSGIARLWTPPAPSQRAAASTSKWPCPCWWPGSSSASLSSKASPPPGR